MVSFILKLGVLISLAIVHIPLFEGTKDISSTLTNLTKGTENQIDEEGQIQFLLFSDPSNVRKFHKIEFGNQSSVENANFIVNSTMKILIHGFMQTGFSNFPSELTEAYLQGRNSSKDINILVLDWGKLATGFTPGSNKISYDIAVKNVFTVGKHLARFLSFLHKAGFLKNYEDVHLIGFSLGAQIAGVAGLEVAKQSTESDKRKVGRITGLDPAGPLFYTTPLDQRLDPSDGYFVDVIHTNAGFLGYSKAQGHVDVFPNGGRRQPGCDKDWTGECSHAHAHKIYKESIYDSDALIACKCESWKNFEKCKTACAEELRVGEPCPNTARGSYFMETKA